MEISAKKAKDIQSLTDFAKNLYPRSLAGLLIQGSLKIHYIQAKTKDG